MNRVASPCRFSQLFYRRLPRYSHTADARRRCSTRHCSWRARRPIEPRPSDSDRRNATLALPKRTGAHGYRRSEMTDNTTIAAILASGMLPPISAPATDADGAITAGEQARFVMDVLHAVGLYRAVLEALAIQAKD